MEIRCGRDFEDELFADGLRLIAGVDEVGRGALAGPVVAAAVMLNLEAVPDGINDSKKLSRRERERLAEEIRKSAIAISLASVEAEEIDRINILQATRKAMKLAIGNLCPRPEFLLIDALALDIPLLQKSIIRGDEVSISIAAASIIAKVERDHLMTGYDSIYPGYGFSSHVGYGTRQHIEALRSLGPSSIHRKTFHGVSEYVLQ